jgi:YhhN family
MNKRLPQIIIILFFLTLFVHLYAIVFQVPTIRIITKCLLLPLLCIYLMVSTPNTTVIKKIALTALFYSWLGDVVLLGDGNYFQLGMLAFSIAHVRNGRILVRLQAIQLKGATWIGLGLALGTISLVYYFLQYSLGTFLVPVVVYMVVISAVWVLSFNLTNQPKYKAVAINFFIPGMLLFVLSDTLLALNKFLFHNPAGWDAWIMVTYALAQWLLTEGYIRVVNGAREESNP